MGSQDGSDAPISSKGFRLNGAGIVLIVWTFFVWGGRVRNMIADGVPLDGAEVWRPILVASFLGLAVAATVLAGLFLKSPTKRYRGWYRLALVALAVLGIVVWLIRGPDIALGDHEAAFIVVHSVLALSTIGLGVVVLWCERSALLARSSL